MTRWALLATALLLNAACGGGVTGPSAMPIDAVSQVSFAAATNSDLAGRWQVTSVAIGSAYDDVFESPMESSPLSLTFSGDVVVFASPCRSCQASRPPTNGVMSVGPMSCEPRACTPDRFVEDGADAVTASLPGNVSATVVRRSADLFALTILLKTSSGYIQLQR